MVPGLDDVVCLTVFMLIFMPQWASSGMKTTGDYLLLCFSFFGPLMFSSQTPALPKAICHGSLSYWATFQGHPSESASRKGERVGMGLFLWHSSFPQFSGSFFWALSLSCHSIQVFPAGDLPLNLQASLSLSLVSSLPFIFSFLRSDHEDLKGQIPGSLAMCWVLRSLIHNWIVMNWKTPYRSEQLWIPPLPPREHGLPSWPSPLIPPPQLPLRFLLDPAQRGMAPRGPFTCLLSHSICDWLPPPAKCDLSSYLSTWQRGPPLF